jgi:predicted nucleotidyltransferase
VIISLADVVRLMNGRDVRYIVIGGWAALIHGSARSTNDVDLVYDRAGDNIHRLVEALQPWRPYLRGAPPGLPFRWDAATVAAGLNFTLTTDHGDLDLLGEVSGGGSYQQLLPFCQKAATADMPFWVVGLERLIQLKRAAGRAKDLQDIAELQALLEERNKLNPS